MTDNGSDACPDWNEAQGTVGCEDCEKTLDVNHYCLDCPGSLCDACKDFHLQRKISRNHTLVRYEDQLARKVRIIISLGKCKDHPLNRLERYCDRCRIPCCVICATSIHKCHKISDVIEKVEEAERNIIAHRCELEEFCTEHSSFSELLKNKKSDVDCHYETLFQDVRDILFRIHTVVDEEGEKLVQGISAQRDKDAAAIKANIKFVQTKTLDCKQVINKCNRTILASSCQNLQFKKANSTSLNVKRHDLNCLDLVPKPIDFQSFKYIINQIENSIKKSTQVLNGRYEIRFIAKFCTEEVSGTIAVSDKACSWVHEEDSFGFFEYDRSGLLLNLIESLDEIRCFILFEGKIIGTVADSNRVVEVSSRNGSTKILVDLNPFSPYGICLNHRRNIVFVVRNIESALFEYTPDGKRRIQTIWKDDSGENLFSSPTIVQQNKNNDYIVCEMTKIVTVSSDGKLRWEYSGDSTREKMFKPYAFCCDNYSNVIVADFDNGIIDILSRKGKFVSSILTQRNGIMKPYALSVDDDDYLWVGSSSRKEILIFSYFG